MTGVEGMPGFTLGGFSMEAKGPGVVMRGALSVRDPAVEVLPAIRKVHEAAAGQITELTVDLRELRFVNSSAMRVFLEWSAWIHDEPESRRYRLHLLSDTSIAWQRLSLPTIRSLAPEAIRISSNA